ncbi:serine hydrolase domain-containing protein [Pseudohaliea rubra]|uniref:Beta-lactamase class C and other penicillin binding protein n=1 Tax=Pseudohaliea rubra DSM 19751 TaxID=1265313 RepID=A0A095VQV0_9GAMM|nr:serine hydrolase domain-containing protein [Pseudohaliea rubra]KGE03478.1 Beta-lactamase class C and other penicillin binding protein [Pseudohaliea rubra DSM 19751]
MRQLALSLLLFACGTLTAAPDPAATGFSAERLARIDRHMDAAVAAGIMVGGEGLIARGGDVVYHATWGDRDREAGRPATTDTLYRIYSMTKPVTTVAVLMLYEEGHFLLGDPVAEYLPELADLAVAEDLDPNTPLTTRTAARQPTIRDLLRHSAGFSYGLFGDSSVDRRYREAGLFQKADLPAFTETLGTLPLQYEPGTRWHYSVAVDVQGRLVEAVSGMSLGDFFRERIFEPLGMTDTHFLVPAAKRDRLAQLYSPRGTTMAPDAPWQFSDEQALQVADPELTRSYVEGNVFESGGGGLVSTARDYLRFARMLAGDGAVDGVRLLAPLTVRHLRRNHVAGLATDNLYSIDGFGLGVGVSVDPGATGELGADGSYGWGGAAGTRFWVDPVDDIVGIFMTQSVPHQTKLADTFRVLTYGALLETNRDRVGANSAAW